MKRGATTTFIPIVIAVAATAGIGVYIKGRQQNPEGDSAAFKHLTVPKSVRLEVLEMKAGPLPEEPVERIGHGFGAYPYTPAFWVRYETFADDKKLSVSHANDRLRFAVRGEDGSRWPIQLARGKNANYLLILGGYPIEAKNLTLHCTYRGSQEVGSWKIPALPPPSRHVLQASDPSAIARDFPGVSAKAVAYYGRFDLISLESSATASQQPPGHRISARLKGHEYLPVVGEQPLLIPRPFAEKLKLAEVEVSDERDSVGTETVTLPSGRVITQGGEHTIQFDKPPVFDLGDGLSLSFDPIPGSTGPRVRPSFTKANQRLPAYITSVSSPDVDVDVGGGSIKLGIPAGVAMSDPIRLQLRVVRIERRSKTYVLPVRPEAAPRIGPATPPMFVTPGRPPR